MMRCVAAVGMVLLAGSVAFAQEPLEPADLLRSLMRVQDTVAAGDRAALPMQAQIVTMLDDSFREAGAAVISDPRNMEALLIYGMAGGNQRTVSAIVAQMPPDHPQYRLSKAVADYMSGRTGRAIEIFKEYQPLEMRGRMAPFVALAKGSVNVQDNPEVAVRSFNAARLLAPGTLVEEAVLRRLQLLHLQRKDPAGFISVSSQYARRFVRSPYADQFADTFLDGALAMGERISPMAMAEVAETMPPAHRNAIFLRLARKAALEGNTELSDFATSRIVKRDADGDGMRSTALRSQLYADLGSMNAENAAEVLKRLKAIDEDYLPPEDVRLLRAARGVAESIVRPIAPVPGFRAIPRQILPGPTAEELGTIVTPARISANSDDSENREAAIETAEPDIELFVTGTREKLKAIDDLIDEAR